MTENKQSWSYLRCSNPNAKHKLLFRLTILLNLLKTDSCNHKSMNLIMVVRFHFFNNVRSFLTNKSTLKWCVPESSWTRPSEGWVSATEFGRESPRTFPPPWASEWTRPFSRLRQPTFGGPSVASPTAGISEGRRIKIKKLSHKMNQKLLSRTKYERKK